jgi:hypothetical protein
MGRHLFVVLIFGLLGLSGLRASADVAPPRDYVEKCTLEAYKKAGADCRVCGASFQGREACTKLVSQGYHQRCRSHGASVWREVWCRGNPKAEKDQPR